MGEDVGRGLGGMGYRVEVFVQGVGWQKLGDAVGLDDALDLGATAVINSYLKMPEKHGSKTGDVVGFRVTESDFQQTSNPVREIRWADVKHRFFRRGNAYFLYKTWSWPD